jgi:hypothetical protein
MILLGTEWLIPEDHPAVGVTAHRQFAATFLRNDLS